MHRAMKRAYSVKEWESDHHKCTVGYLDGDFVSEDGCCVSLPSSESVS